MWFKALTFLGLILGPMLIDAGCPSQSPIRARPVEPDWKAPEKYLSYRRHDVVFRDHGCTDFPEKTEQSYHCVDLWFKNKFSEANPAVAPTQVFTDFQYYGTDHSWKPAVTWVENINPWRARACAAAPGGMKGALNKGKMRWFALYNLPQTPTEQSGVISAAVIGPVTTGIKCMHVDFPQAFPAQPTIKLQLKLQYGLMSAVDAMSIWAKAVTTTGLEVCMEEFYARSAYHHEFEIHWYGISSAHSQDNYASHSKVVFPAGIDYPANHAELNKFFCQNVTIPRLYPCPAILLQPVIPSMAACESPVVAWVAYQKNDMATVCYADKRGIMDKRKTNVEVHIITYGHQDPCISLTCPATQECIHPTWNTAACGCHTHCPEDDHVACGTNMKTYANKCLLEKAACEAGNTFSYAHHGKCEKYTMDHGREQLQSVASCDGLYCKVISTRNNVWYPNADINVQISVNWMNKIDGEMPTTHEATSSWVENVTPNTFRACVMEAGGRDLLDPPYINWFAYQGELPETTSQKIEVGDWRSGTHCVPVHQRTVMEKPIENHPPVCASTEMSDGSQSSEDEKYHYDASVMSKIFGKEQHDWMKRMMGGYGVKRLNLTNGMKIMNATLMMTVEHTVVAKTRSSPQDAVNVWMEYDVATHEAYVCLREMSNWDGLHTGIHVHWTFFNNSMIEDVGYSKKLLFKPHMMSSMYNNYAFCQTKEYKPANFSLVPGSSATVLVSVEHKIPPHSAFESMKKYRLYQEEVRRGMPMGEFEFNKREEQPSWLVPHMWRGNLSGWRPHMRIDKNSDHSAWVEGMNDTHIKVCQKSLYTGFHYEGVMVSLFILPDRCQSGYHYLNSGMCGSYVDTCGTPSAAQSFCASSSAFLGAPENPRDNYWLSYLAGQKSIYLAKSDEANEGVWVRAFGNPSTSNYSRWAPDYPRAALVTDDCSVQRGRANDFTEIDASCTGCNGYVCVKSAPLLSCSMKDYCMNDGKCIYKGYNQLECECKESYSGARCEIKA